MHACKITWIQHTHITAWLNASNSDEVSINRMMLVYKIEVWVQCHTCSVDPELWHTATSLSMIEEDARLKSWRGDRGCSEEEENDG